MHVYVIIYNLVLRNSSSLPVEIVHEGLGAFKYLSEIIPKFTIMSKLYMSTCPFDIYRL